MFKWLLNLSLISFSFILIFPSSSQAAPKMEYYKLRLEMTLEEASRIAEDKLHAFYTRRSADWGLRFTYREKRYYTRPREYRKVPARLFGGPYDQQIELLRFSPEYPPDKGKFLLQTILIYGDRPRGVGYMAFCDGFRSKYGNPDRMYDDRDGCRIYWRQGDYEYCVSGYSRDGKNKYSIELTYNIIKRYIAQIKKKIKERKKIVVARDRPCGQPKVRLRSVPRYLSKKHVKNMLRRYNFFDERWNKDGGFVNDFLDNGDGTVTDCSTGLMWAKRSSNHMSLTFTEAEEYVTKLNTNKFGGYSDWHLPTAEEFASVLGYIKDGHLGTVIDWHTSIHWGTDRAEDDHVWCTQFYKDSCFLFPSKIRKGWNKGGWATLVVRSTK